MDERKTEELRIEQHERESREDRLARSSSDAREVAQHERRAQKAHYLRRKLEERDASERNADR
jgi:hypothetical protein